MKKTFLFIVLALMWVKIGIYAQVVNILVPLTLPDGTETSVYMKFSLSYQTAEVVSDAYGVAIDKSTQGVISIPQKIKYKGWSYTVTEISGGAFSGCSGLTSVIIPSSVTKIDMYAFSGCTGLTSVTIPEGVTQICEKTFSGCTGLTSMTIPEGVTVIWSDAFSGCTGLTSVTIPEGVTRIDNSAFRGCSGLTSVTIPSSVTSISDWTFDGCSGLTSVTIPEGVTSIGNYAFRGCSGLTSVTIPSSVTSIGYSAFSGCSGLTSVIIPSSVTKIDMYAFSGCTGLTSMTIPSSVTKIYENTFSGCTGLTSVTIPSSVTSIGNSAFYGCSGLTSVTIPSSVTSIGYSAFYGCSGLTSVNIPSSVTTIGNSAFKDCTGLTSVNISEGVTSIGESTFENCTSLTSVTIPSSVTSIGNRAFYGCTSLTSITLPDNMESVYGGYSLYAFPASCHLLVNRGSKTLLTLWRNNILPYDATTNEELPRPYLEMNTTATSLTFTLRNYYEEYEYYARYRRYPYDDFSKDVAIEGEGAEVTVSGIRPNYRIDTDLTCRMKDGDHYYFYSSNTMTVYTKNVEFETLQVTPTKAVIRAKYTEKDVDIVNEVYTVNSVQYVVDEEGTVTITGADPGSTIYYSMKVGPFTYDVSTKITLQPLTFSTQQAKVISVGNVIVSAESNISDEETNVGFEWRRTDWTDDFPSNTGVAYLYEGTMEGYIRNLNTDKLWKFRPYYLSDSGTYYYGDWMGLDPTNTSYFEPTVHTYASIEVEGNTALVKGYALNGTDKIAVQGFKYWKETSNANGASMAPAHAPTVPSSAQTVEAEGRVMEATITGLDYETEYRYVAFVKTTEGETFYGDVRSFTTGVNTTGISEMACDDATGDVHEVARYNLHGQCIDTPERGINIIRYSDGTTRKVVVR